MRHGFKYVVITTIFVLALQCSGMAATDVFKDISKHWAKDSINYLKSLGYVSGYSDDTFKPDNKISRAEFLVLLIKSMGLTAADNSNSSFVKDTASWAKPYLNEAIKRNIVLPSEYSTGFKPSDGIYRSEVAAMLVRALGKSPADGNTSFKDQASIDHSDYKKYIKAASDLGLMSGDTNGNFQPFATMTRGQACQVFKVFIGKLSPSASDAGNQATTGNIQQLIIGENSYSVGILPIVFKDGTNSISVTSINTTGNSILVNGQYTYQLNSSSGNPDIVIKNKRYSINTMSVDGVTLNVQPKYRKINTITFNGQTYQSETVNMIINSQSGNYTLADMELIDQSHVRLDGYSYDLSTDQISISCDTGVGRITGVIFDADNTTLEFNGGTADSSYGLQASDIISIIADGTALNQTNTSSINFIIDRIRYPLSAVTVDTSGTMSVSGGSAYSPSSISMIYNDQTYKLVSLQWSQSKLIITCSTDDTTWAVINNQYWDSAQVKFIKDSNYYNFSKVLVISSNTLRISGKQFTLNNNLQCCYNDQIYSITNIDFNTTLNLVTITTSTSTVQSSQPVKFNLFKNNVAITYTSGTLSILAGSVWVNLSSVYFPDPSHFTHNNTTYSLIGATLLVDSQSYTISDTSWHGSTQIMDLYMKD